MSTDPHAQSDSGERRLARVRRWLLCQGSGLHRIGRYGRPANTNRSNWSRRIVPRAGPAPYRLIRIGRAAQPDVRSRRSTFRHRGPGSRAMGFVAIAPGAAFSEDAHLRRGDVLANGRPLRSTDSSVGQFHVFGTGVDGAKDLAFTGDQIYRTSDPAYLSRASTAMVKDAAERPRGGYLDRSSRRRFATHQRRKGR